LLRLCFARVEPWLQAGKSSGWRGRRRGCFAHPAGQVGM